MGGGLGIKRDDVESAKAFLYGGTAAGASGPESSDFEFLHDDAREGEFGSGPVLDAIDTSPLM